MSVMISEINQNQNLLKNYFVPYKPLFRGSKKYENNTAADKFIKKVEKENKKAYKGNLLWSKTASIVTLIPIIIYEALSLIKLNKLKKSGSTANAQLAAKKILKNFSWLIPIGITAIAGLQYIFEKQTDKNFIKSNKIFDEINADTSATLDSKVLGSGYIAAVYYPFSDKIQVSKSYINDPIERLHLKEVLKHELIHAKQAELIARSKDGIKKLNYAMLKNLANNIEKSPKDLKEFEDTYESLMQDSEGKYDNTVINIFAINLRLKDFINAIHILINNKNATYNDIPMCADENHYKKVVEQKGPLTPEEEKLAEQYYQSYMTYSWPKNFLDGYNPKSSYRKNELEIEAYR